MFYDHGNDDDDDDDDLWKGVFIFVASTVQCY